MELKSIDELYRKYPKYIMDILNDKMCDLSYGIVLLQDYKSKTYNRQYFVNSFKKFKEIKENNNGKIL